MKVYICFEADYPGDTFEAVGELVEDDINAVVAPAAWTYEGWYADGDKPTWVWDFGHKTPAEAPAQEEEK